MFPIKTIKCEPHTVYNTESDNLDIVSIINFLIVYYETNPTWIYHVQLISWFVSYDYGSGVSFAPLLFHC